MLNSLLNPLFNNLSFSNPIDSFAQKTAEFLNQPTMFWDHTKAQAFHKIASEQLQTPPHEYHPLFRLRKLSDHIIYQANDFFHDPKTVMALGSVALLSVSAILFLNWISKETDPTPPPTKKPYNHHLDNLVALRQIRSINHEETVETKKAA